MKKLRVQSCSKSPVKLKLEPRLAEAQSLYSLTWSGERWYMGGVRGGVGDVRASESQKASWGASWHSKGRNRAVPKARWAQKEK